MSVQNDLLTRDPSHRQLRFSLYSFNLVQRLLHSTKGMVFHYGRVVFPSRGETKNRTLSIQGRGIGISSSGELNPSKRLAPEKLSMNTTERDIPVHLVVWKDHLASIEKQIQLAEGAITQRAESFQPPLDEIDDYAEARFKPLILIAARLSATMLIKLISEMLLDHQHPGGQIIDARNRPPLCRPAPFLERGMLVLITNNGLIVYEPHEKNEAIETLGALFRNSNHG
jgi:hypothetical protein